MSFERPSHGPQLPYQLIAGVTPCPGGWLVASAKIQGTNMAVEDPRVFEHFVEVIDEKPAFNVVALNAPIGLPDQPSRAGRNCDQLARSMLGPRRIAVRPAPDRSTVETPGDWGHAGLDAATRGLLPRYREVAAEMAPYRQRTIFEANAELAFFVLNDDQPLRWAKRRISGRQERRELLERRIKDVERVLDARLRGPRLNHLLDAAACLWTARRIMSRAALRLPVDPEWNDEGLRMEVLR